MNPHPPELTIQEVHTINRRIKLQSSRQLRLINSQTEIIKNKDAYIVELEQLLDKKIIYLLKIYPKPPTKPRKSTQNKQKHSKINHNS